MNPSPPTHTARPDGDRLWELLADRALVGLDADEQAELAGLLPSGDDMIGREFDLAAGAGALAMLSADERNAALPASLRQKLLADVDSYPAVRSPEPKPEPKPVATPEPKSAPAPRQAASDDGPATVRLLVTWGGWAAAAAALAFAFLRPGPTAPVAPVEPPKPGLVETVDTSGDALRIAWKDPGGGPVAGEVVWSDRLQQGYMRFRGLAANDPAREQYQLWIFDKQRKPEHPVDGGVFDVSAPADPGGDVVVPIAAKLPVKSALGFAVTVEAPGGVVVSERKRIAALALPG
jgi:hypothetical protein